MFLPFLSSLIILFAQPDVAPYAWSWLAHFLDRCQELVGAADDTSIAVIVKNELNRHLDLWWAYGHDVHQVSCAAFVFL